MTRLVAGPAFRYSRPTVRRFNGRRRYARERRACGTRRHLGVEAEAPPLSRPNPNRTQVAIMLIDGRAYPEKA